MTTGSNMLFYNVLYEKRNIVSSLAFSSILAFLFLFFRFLLGKVHTALGCNSHELQMYRMYQFSGLTVRLNAIAISNHNSDSRIGMLLKRT